MASPSLPPYEYEEIVELNYEFVNRDGIRYHLYFKNNNPNKQQLVNSFNELMSRDIYEIVV